MVTPQQVAPASSSVAPSAATTIADPAESVTAFLIARLDTGETLHADEAFETITGHPVSALLADASLLARALHPDHLQAASVYAQAFWAGRSCHLEARIVRRDGELRWIRFASAPVPWAAGETRMVTSLTDITAWVAAAETARAAEQAERAAHEAKSALISRMSHELRTPLNAVIGFGQLLERRTIDPEDLSSVQYILSSGRHLLGMIEEVLDISRIGAGKPATAVEPVEAPSLIDEVVNLMRPSADRAGVRVAVEAGPPGLRLLGDRPRLAQVLQNLLTHAIHANRPGGHIWISWSALGGASLSVRDDASAPGPGRQQPLHTSDPVDVELAGSAGTGVALSATRALVELMGGTMSAESVPGSGSSFTVTLPAAPDRRAAPTASAPATATSQKGAGPTTLLYVEDNQPNVRVVTSLLKLRPGWQLVHAGLGGTGLELARSRRPDLVLLDLHLPDCFGLSVLESLKADPATAGIPVVVLSADANLSQVERLLQAGAAQYLTKPLDVHEVLMLLDGITADQRSRMVDA